MSRLVTSSPTSGCTTTYPASASSAATVFHTTNSSSYLVRPSPFRITAIRPVVVSGVSASTPDTQQGGQFRGGRHRMARIRRARHGYRDRDPWFRVDGEQWSLGPRHGASVECDAEGLGASLALRVRRAVEDMDRWAASVSRTASSPT